MDTYVASWRAVAAQEAKALSVCRERALTVAVAVARELRARGATEVILVGSLARDDFRSGSDVDLAVCGIGADDLNAVEASWAEGAEVAVDLLRMESMRPRWRAYHERFGRRIGE